MSCIVVLSLIFLGIYLFRSYRRRTRRALAINSRRPRPYAAVYHADNPVYDEVYTCTTESVGNDGYEIPRPARVETVAILPMIPQAAGNGNECGAAGPAFQQMLTNPANDDEVLTEDEIKDFNALRQWGKMHKKTHRKEEWIEMTVLK